MKKLLFAMLAAFLAMPAGYCQTKDTTGLAQMVSDIINNVEKNRQNRNKRIDNYEGKGTMVFFARKIAGGFEEVSGINWLAKDGTPTIEAWYRLKTNDTLDAMPPVAAEGGSVLRFYFQGGDSLTLRCMDYAKMKLSDKGINEYSGEYYEVYYLRAYYPMTVRDMVILKGNTITAFRLELSDRTIMEPIQGFEQEKMTEFFDALDIERMIEAAEFQRKDD